MADRRTDRLAIIISRSACSQCWRAIKTVTDNHWRAVHGEITGAGKKVGFLKEKQLFYVLKLVKYCVCQCFNKELLTYLLTYLGLLCRTPGTSVPGRTQNYDRQAQWKEEKQVQWTKIRPCEFHKSQFIFEYHIGVARMRKCMEVTKNGRVKWMTNKTFLVLFILKWTDYVFKCLFKKLSIVVYTLCPRKK